MIIAHAAPLLGVDRRKCVQSTTWSEARTELCTGLCNISQSPKRLTVTSSVASGALFNELSSRTGRALLFDLSTVARVMMRRSMKFSRSSTKRSVLRTPLWRRYWLSFCACSAPGSVHAIRGFLDHEHAHRCLPTTAKTSRTPHFSVKATSSRAGQHQCCASRYGG